MGTDGSVGGMKGWARIPMMGLGCATAVGGGYEKHLSVKKPDWEAEVIAAMIYQSAVLILRESGSYSAGRKINSRGATEEECGSLTGNGSGGMEDHTHQ